MAYKKDGTRSYDAPNPKGLTDFMKSGWAPSPLESVKPKEFLSFIAERRKRLSAQFPGKRIVFPAGSQKVRSNDTHYKFRAHTEFTYYTGILSSDVVPDSVLILEPISNGHEAILFVHPRSPRDSEEFYRNAKYGEFWIGRRMTLEETESIYGLKVMHVEKLDDFLAKSAEVLFVRNENSDVDEKCKMSEEDEKNFNTYLSEARLIKDAYEIAETQKAVDATALVFADMVRVFGEATKFKRGERLIEGAFYTRARTEGNDLGYDTILASGAHACILHWIKNDGEVIEGDLILIDAGVEVESLYTADVTRCFPVNGKFSKAQREIYELVYAAQRAGIAAAKPGAKFTDLNAASHKVLAEGLEKMGVLPISAEESLKPDVGLHKRWTVHGVSHMLGLDVHDCDNARSENYRDGVLKPGMILTVEPGLYVHPDDELFPAEYRGIGVRIEDDVLITETGCKVLSDGLPTQVDEVEKWMAQVKQRA
jgi:Xaa-Pro aminopeptidase